MPEAHQKEFDTAPDAPGEPHAGPRLIAVLAGAGCTVAMMQTLVLPLLPRLPELLHTSSSNASWVVTATLLAAAVSTPVIGRLGDMFGKRRMMLVCCAFVVVGCATAALSSSVLPMVTGRALQGCGFALIPLGMSLMRDVVAPQRLSSAIALMSSALGIGGAIGLPLAAGIADSLGWHAPFWFGACLGVLFCALMLAFVPESSQRVRERIDYVGAIGLMVGLACVLLAISKGGDWGWASSATLGTLSAAVLILIAWTRWELGVAAPVVDLRTSAERPVLTANLTGLTTGLAMYAMNLLAPRILQLPAETGYGLNQSIFASGLWMLPSGVAMMIIPTFAAKLTTSRGPKRSVMVGITIILIGNATSQALIGHLWGMVLFTVIVSGGIAFSYAALPTAIMRAVPAKQTAAANALNTLSRTMGTSTASAVVGAVLGQMTATIGGTVYPSEAGVRTTLAIGVGSSLIALAVAALMPETTRRVAPDPTEAPAARVVAAEAAIGE